MAFPSLLTGDATDGHLHLAGHAHAGERVAVRELVRGKGGSLSLGEERLGKDRLHGSVVATHVSGVVDTLGSLEVTGVSGGERAERDEEEREGLHLKPLRCRASKRRSLKEETRAGSRASLSTCALRGGSSALVALVFASLKSGFVA